jgi:hypothetical protein
MTTTTARPISASSTLDANDVVATLQVLRRANIIAPDRLPDALLAVMRARLLPWRHGEAVMGRLGVTKSEMARARNRPLPPAWQLQSTKDAAEPRPKGNTTGRDPLREYARKPSKAPTTARPVTEDGQLRCSVCGKWKDPEDFKLRSDRIGSGTRRSACDPCHNAANRARYLNVEAKASLNAVGLSFTIQDGDEAASLSCASCGQRLEVGQDVRTVHDSAIRHITCPGVK